MNNTISSINLKQNYLSFGQKPQKTYPQTALTKEEKISEITKKLKSIKETMSNSSQFVLGRTKLIDFYSPISENHCTLEASSSNILEALSFETFFGAFAGILALYSSLGTCSDEKMKEKS